MSFNKFYEENSILIKVDFYNAYSLTNQLHILHSCYEKGNALHNEL